MEMFHNTIDFSPKLYQFGSYQMECFQDFIAQILMYPESDEMKKILQDFEEHFDEVMRMKEQTSDSDVSRSVSSNSASSPHK